jgi:hypothetical protein
MTLVLDWLSAIVLSLSFVAYCFGAFELPRYIVVLLFFVVAMGSVNDLIVHYFRRQLPPRPPQF